MSTGQLSSLRGTLRLARFRLLHHRPSLDRAIRHLEQSTAHMPTSHADRPLVLAALSNALIWRYELTSHRADLDGAIDRLREAMRSPTTSGAERAGFGSDLAAMLRARFLAGGEVADLDEAVDAATTAIELGQETNGAITNRALVLLARYERTADVDDLLGALRDARTPVRGPLQAAFHRATRLGALVDALSARYQYTGDAADLAATVAAGREALATLSRADPLRAQYAAGVSNALRLSDDAARRSEAVDWAEEAVRTSSPEHVDYAYVLSSLSMALLMRHLHTDDLDDLRRARATADEVRTAGPDRNRPMLLQRIGLLARRWYDVTADEAALGHGEQAIREALAMTGDDHPLRGPLICELIDLRRRRPPGRAEWAELRELLIPVVRDRRDGTSIRFALRAATRLGELSAESGDTADSLLGFTRAVELLQTAAWPGLRRAVREARLQDAPRAADAAAQAVRAGRRAAAVELLDAGRAVLWSQQLDLRTDLDALRESAPGLAERLHAVRGRLEHHDAGWDVG